MPNVVSFHCYYNYISNHFLAVISKKYCLIPLRNKNRHSEWPLIAVIQLIIYGFCKYEHVSVCVRVDAKCQTVAGWHLTWPVSLWGNFRLCGQRVSDWVLEASSSLTAFNLQPNIFTCTQSSFLHLSSCSLSSITILLFSQVFSSSRKAHLLFLIPSLFSMFKLITK